MRKRFIAACALLFPVSAISLLMRNSGAETSSLTEADAGELRPGEFIWRPELAPSGAMSMTIDLGRQRAYVHRDGVCIGVSTISSGRRGHETPTGTFTVLEKERFHRSNRYDNAPMPYMQRLTEYGIALHGGHLPGHPASHGCIRLPLGFAAALFKEPTVGMTVRITEQGRNEEDSTDSGTGVQTCEADESP